MAAGVAKCQGKAMSDKDKAERLAAKLRENLRRRKAQARDINGAKEERTPPPAMPAPRSPD
jgi:hypothetical protein